MSKAVGVVRHTPLCTPFPLVTPLPHAQYFEQDDPMMHFMSAQFLAGLGREAEAKGAYVRAGATGIEAFMSGAALSIEDVHLRLNLRKIVGS